VRGERRHRLGELTLGEQCAPDAAVVPERCRREQRLLDDVALRAAAADRAQRGARAGDARSRAVEVAAAERDDAVEQRRADRARDGAVPAALALGGGERERDPLARVRELAGADERHRRVHVVEERVAGGRLVELPAGDERAPALADLAADKRDPPEQRRRVDALQRDLDPALVEVVVEERERVRDRERLEREQRLVPAEVAREAVRSRAAVGRIAHAPMRSPRRHPVETFAVAALHRHDVRDGVDRPRHARVGSERAPSGRLGFGVAP